MSAINLIKLALCAPGDVQKELAIAQEVIHEWNLQHAESYDFWVKYQHWSTDSSPDLSDRPQAVINRQIIDESDVIVAIFWSRFGTPTGAAGSGTEEEIRRGLKLGRRVLVYFSDLEPLPAKAETKQLERLWSFRQELQAKGLCWQFSAREQFRRDFARHLAKTLSEFASPKSQSSHPGFSQTIIGDNNFQAARDLNVFQQSPKIKKVIEKSEGSVSPKERHQIQTWITELAEGEVGLTRDEAFSMWWSRFKNRFGVDKYEELPSSQLGDAEKWFRQQRAIQTRSQKRKAPEYWRRDRITAIKSAMTRMGVSKEIYYPQVAQRLKMKKPFLSLKNLTKRDLDRVYSMALRDAKEL